MHIYEALMIFFIFNFFSGKIVINKRQKKKKPKTIFNLFRVFHHFVKWQVEKTFLKCNVKSKEIKDYIVNY